MKKTFFLLTVAILMVFSISCKKEDTNSMKSTPTTPTGYFITVNVNGTDYTEPITEFGNGWDEPIGCDSLSYNVASLLDFNQSTFGFYPYITHRKNNINFLTNSTGTYQVRDNTLMVSSDYILCNWQLGMTFDYNSQPTVLQPNGTNKITSITKNSETSTIVKYDIVGNFDFTVKNSAIASMHITGSYKTCVETLK